MRNFRITYRNDCGEMNTECEETAMMIREWHEVVVADGHFPKFGSRLSTEGYVTSDESFSPSSSSLSSIDFSMAGERTSAREKYKNSAHHSYQK
jgi:hypothetical protein